MKNNTSKNLDDNWIGRSSFEPSATKRVKGEALQETISRNNMKYFSYRLKFSISSHSVFSCTQMDFYVGFWGKWGGIASDLFWAF